jgi:hypothetical protein
MPSSNEFLPLQRSAWLLEIGRRLKADYEALREPVPERLARLVQLAEDRCRADDDEGASPETRAERAAAESD